MCSVVRRLFGDQTKVDGVGSFPFNVPKFQVRLCAFAFHSRSSDDVCLQDVRFLPQLLHLYGSSECLTNAASEFLLISASVCPSS